MPNDSRPDNTRDFEALIASRRASMVRLAAKILGDASLAEDVVQETLSATWQRLDRVRPGKLKAYLFRAVQFNALKRRARRRNHAPLDDDVAAPTEDADEGIAPDELERALEGLPPTQQAVLRMKFYVGLTFREIGEALPISANTAASRCRYAIATLRKALRRN